MEKFYSTPILFSLTVVFLGILHFAKNILGDFVKVSGLKTLDLWSYKTLRLNGAFLTYSKRCMVSIIGFVDSEAGYFSYLYNFLYIGKDIYVYLWISNFYFVLLSCLLEPLSFVLWF